MILDNMMRHLDSWRENDANYGVKVINYP